MENKARKGHVFICLADAHAIALSNQETHVYGARAVYYSTRIGRRRNYRNAFPIPNEGMRLKTFKTRKAAQDLADYTNKHYRDDFKVVEITEELAKACMTKFVRST